MICQQLTSLVCSIHILGQDSHMSLVAVNELNCSYSALHQIFVSNVGFNFHL
jgi:Ni2+-binding GTPase involved in maturation of urease and hydrogenase